jgi:hypothetical protein
LEDALDVSAIAEIEQLWLWWESELERFDTHHQKL